MSTCGNRRVAVTTAVLTVPGRKAVIEMVMVVHCLKSCLLSSNTETAKVTASHQMKYRHPLDWSWGSPYFNETFLLYSSMAFHKIPLD